MKNGEFHHFWEISATCTDTGAVQLSRTEPVPVQMRNKCGTASRTEPVPVQVRVVPVHVVLCFSILTSIRILAINCSFLIQFELFKLLVKLDFKETKIL